MSLVIATHYDTTYTGILLLPVFIGLGLILYLTAHYHFTSGFIGLVIALSACCTQILQNDSNSLEARVISGIFVIGVLITNWIYAGQPPALFARISSRIAEGRIGAQLLFSMEAAGELLVYAALLLRES